MRGQDGGPTGIGTSLLLSAIILHCLKQVGGTGEVGGVKMDALQVYVHLYCYQPLFCTAV